MVTFKIKNIKTVNNVISHIPYTFNLHCKHVCIHAFTLRNTYKKIVFKIHMLMKSFFGKNL